MRKGGLVALHIGLVGLTVHIGRQGDLAMLDGQLVQINRGFDDSQPICQHLKHRYRRAMKMRYPRLDHAAQRGASCVRAIQLQHSVETLVSTYVGALENEESVGNTKIDRFLSGESDE